MWLKLTTVQLIALDKKKPKELSSIVRQSRINMDRINSYFEASENQKNHKSEDARFNTILDATLVQEANGVPYGIMFCVKETVEEIDDMLASYGIDEATQPVIEEAPAKEEAPTKIMPKVDDSWGKSGW